MSTPRDRKAPLQVGIAVGAAAGVVITILIAVVSFYVVRASRVDLRHPHGRGPGRDRWQERIVDLGDLLPALIVFGIVAVALIGVIAWWATRLANEPLERALRIQRAFVADASHELRTPLTTISSRVQLAQHRMERGGDVGGALEDLTLDARAMTAVLDDLLTAAEPGPVGATCWADVAAAEALRLVAPQAAAAQVALVEDVPAGIGVGAGQAALSRALVALLDNAVRHSPQGGSVSLSATADQKQVFLRVWDNGPGLGSTDPESLFERFVRAPGSGRGFGLGLALVRDIAERFSGTVRVESTGPTGTVFLLCLPRVG